MFLSLIHKVPIIYPDTCVTVLMLSSYQVLIRFMKTVAKDLDT